MTIIQALNEVSAIYIPGVIDHYAKMNPDPWQKAHDDLERTMLLKDADIFTAGSEHFVSTCKRLLSAFSDLKMPHKELRIADGWATGNEESVKRYHSRKDKHCIGCESKVGLSIISDPKHAAAVLIVCPNCRKRYAA